MINQTTGSVNVGFSPWYIGNATYKVMQQCDDDGHVIYTRYLKDNDSVKLIKSFSYKNFKARL